MPYANFFEHRRSGLLALLESIEEGDRDELDYISSKIYTDTRNDSVPIYDLSCFGAIMGLCHADWMEAEVSLLFMPFVYLPLTQ